jgi:hypothetical protein
MPCSFNPPPAPPSGAKERRMEGSSLLKFISGINALPCNLRHAALLHLRVGEGESGRVGEWESGGIDAIFLQGSIWLQCSARLTHPRPLPPAQKNAAWRGVPY